MEKRLVLIHPHGFCAGVDRATESVYAALERFGPPLYCYHEIVHNQQVLDELREAGVKFVEAIADVPEGAVVVFSAHGVPPATVLEAQKRKLRIVDATCPFVRKVHQEVKRYAAEGTTVLLIGYADHQEVIGVASEAPESVIIVENENQARQVQPPDPERVAVTSQTTLSFTDTNHILAVLNARFPALQSPETSDICYATQNRQAAVREVTEDVEHILVLGGANSSNSRRLVEVARASADCDASLVSSIADLNDLALAGLHVIGLTSGASTPEPFFEEVTAWLVKEGFTQVEKRDVIKEDHAPFRLPPLPEGDPTP